MTAPALESPWLNARQAALYCGFEPAPAGTPRRADPQMRCFYTWAARHGLTQQPGRNVYSREDLDRIIRGGVVPLAEAVAAARQLAREDAAEARRRGRFALARRTS